MEIQRPVWRIDDRGGVPYLYHFLIFNVGALYQAYCPGQTVRVYFPWLHDTETTNVSPYHRELIDLLKPEFEVIATEPSPSEEESCIRNPGTPLFGLDRAYPAAHHFLREFFTKKVAERRGSVPAWDPTLRIYITRKGSNLLRKNYPSKRQILNEDELIPRIQSLGFTYVQLEDYSVLEKIELFMRAAVIVSPQSAGLTFAAFMDPRAHLIELFPDIPGMWHYNYMCEDLELSYTRFTGVDIVGDILKEDLYGAWDMRVRVEEFVEFLGAQSLGAEST